MNPYIYIVSKFVFDSVLDMLGFIEVTGSQRNFPIIRKKNYFNIYFHFLCFFVSGLSVCLSVCFLVSLMVFGGQLIVSHQLFQCHLQYHVLVSEVLTGDQRYEYGAYDVRSGRTIRLG